MGPTWGTVRVVTETSSTANVRPGSASDTRIDPGSSATVTGKKGGRMQESIASASVMPHPGGGA